MFPFSKLKFLALAVAASAVSVPTELVSRAEASIGGIGGISPDAAQVVLVIVCTDINFGNCTPLQATNIPTGCIAVSKALEDTISSAQAVLGVQCTFYQNPGCALNSVIVAGNIPDFRDVGMDNLTSAISCVSVPV
ncbi:hypothetical protein C8J57DRAFT_1722693 [Mycena rebaudengoi]|nr:hypothetical protein C8J57DRAFT_1482257 [Mycena rebaudengoi]KAJ7252954.1 hypothetical protein C8J57DRAFT_1722693 [Mycena rebaudengoi]